MDGLDRREPASRYDRALLLHGAKRNETPTLREIHRYGLDNFCDADHLSLSSATRLSLANLYPKIRASVTQDRADLAGRTHQSTAAITGKSR
jgi:hypothetical protein